MENLSLIWDQNAASRHDQILSGVDVSLDRLVLPKLVSILKSINNYEQLRVIDIGCGTGYLSLELSKHCKHLLAIDNSKRSIDIARKFLSSQTNVTVLLLNIEEVKAVELEKYGIAISNMTFQSIRNLLQAFKAVHDLLVENGVFIFAVPHPAFWPEYKQLTETESYNYHRVSEHMIPFTITNDRNPLPSDVPYIHRSLSEYSAMLNQSDFLISKIYEPFPSEDDQQHFKEPWKSPHFIFFQCVRR